MSKVTDARIRRGIPERWLLPPPPQEPALHEQWHTLSLEQRRALARTRPEQVGELDADQRALVAGLSRARIATSTRLLAAPLIGGLLALAVVWGGLQPTQPGDLALLVGAAVGALTWLVGAVTAARRLRRARQVLAATSRAD